MQPALTQKAFSLKAEAGEKAPSAKGRPDFGAGEEGALLLMIVARLGGLRGKAKAKRAILAASRSEKTHLM